MAKNTNFRLGLDRQELIEASQMFGKSAKTASKDSTKKLESYLTNKLGGRGTKVPDFSEKEKRDIKDASKTFGLQDGMHLLSYRIGKVTGSQDESNFLRLTIARAFTPYYEGGITKKHIDTLMSRMPNMNRSELISGVTRHEPYYQEIFTEYAEELEELENEW